jgi:hypothetical protein
LDCGLSKILEKFFHGSGELIFYAIEEGDVAGAGFRIGRVKIHSSARGREMVRISGIANSPCGIGIAES